MKSSSPTYLEVGKLVGWRPWLLLFQEDTEIRQSLWARGKVGERAKQQLVHMGVCVVTLGQRFFASHSHTHTQGPGHCSGTELTQWAQAPGFIPGMARE